MENFTLEYDSNKQETKKLPTYLNKNAAAEATGIPVSILDEARLAGCPAFNTAGRINLGEFLTWYFKKQLEINKNETVEEKMAKVKLEQEEEKLKKIRELTVTKEKVTFYLQEVMFPLFRVLTRGLTSHLPPLLEGKSTDDIVEINTKFLEETRKTVFQIIEDVRMGVAGKNVNKENEESESEEEVPF